MYSKLDRQMDRQTTRNRNTALCTKVHHAVKTRLQYNTIKTFVLHTVVNCRVDSKLQAIARRAEISHWMQLK